MVAYAFNSALWRQRHADSVSLRTASGTQRNPVGRKERERERERRREKREEKERK